MRVADAGTGVTKNRGSALGSQYLLAGHWHHTGVFSGTSVAPRGTVYGVPPR